MTAPSASDFPLPRPSATVVLLRDTETGPEVLLMLRNAAASFGASFVFPGGLCEAGDAHIAALCDGLDPGTTGFDGEEGTVYYSAAIRELFEESGILLACYADGSLVADNAFDEFRLPIQNGELAWPDFLRAKDLRLACDRLTYFAWWVTPRCRSKRYTTRFLLGAAPQHQHASHDGAELTDSRWLRPADALQLGRDNMPLPRPTRAVLSDLAKHDTVADAIAWATEEQGSGVRCILPYGVEKAGKQTFVVPGDPLYPAELEGAEQ